VATDIVDLHHPTNHTVMTMTYLLHGGRHARQGEQKSVFTFDKDTAYSSTIYSTPVP
jgi:hypothetical protein